MSMTPKMYETKQRELSSLGALTELTEATQPCQPGIVRVDRPVRPLVERLRYMDRPDRMQALGELGAEAASEIERLGTALRKANDQAENFERAWYLAKDDADRYTFAKTLEGQVVTMETFKNRGAAELDQALDDAMAEDADARNEAGYAA